MLTPWLPSRVVLAGSNIFSLFAVSGTILYSSAPHTQDQKVEFVCVEDKLPVVLSRSSVVGNFELVVGLCFAGIEDQVGMG